MKKYNINHLRELESESIFIMREVAAQFENPGLLFSGGKDSIVMVHLARKAFWPARIPFPLVHIDTGHNFEETITFRDELVAELGARLIVGSVQESIDKGRAAEEKGFNASRNLLQTVTLLDTIEEHKLDAALGGGRRDEEKARAKERFFSHRDEFAEKIGARLIVGSVQKSIDEGRVAEEKGPDASRNRLQTTTLLDTIEEHQFDAVLGGGRRDEEKARAKERFFSHRDDFGQWDPKNQRPELWNLFNGRMNPGEHFRVFPLSNWTEMDVWQYIKQENIQLPSLYYAHEREILVRNGTILAVNEFVQPREGETVETRMIRFRTMGDATITGAVESEADTMDKIIEEVAAARQTERGNRADDKRSETSMEDRKKEGYF